MIACLHDFPAMPATSPQPRVGPGEPTPFLDGKNGDTSLCRAMAMAIPRHH